MGGAGDNLNNHITSYILGETLISGYKLLAGAAFGRNEPCPSPAVFHLGDHFLANNTGAFAFA